MTLRSLCIGVILALAALNSSCCCLIVGGSVAGACGGAGLCYAYYKGKVCANYPADFDDAWVATHAALADLGIPIECEKYKKGFIKGRTDKGVKVRVYLKCPRRPVAASGPTTRVGVRVATFGDRAISECVLREIGGHLSPPLLAPAASAGTPAATVTAVP